MLPLPCPVSTLNAHVRSYAPMLLEGCRCLPQLSKQDGVHVHCAHNSVPRFVNTGTNAEWSARGSRTVKDRLDVCCEFAGRTVLSCRPICSTACQAPSAHQTCRLAVYESRMPASCLRSISIFFWASAVRVAAVVLDSNRVVLHTLYAAFAAGP